MKKSICCFGKNRKSIVLKTNSKNLWSFTHNRSRIKSKSEKLSKKKTIFVSVEKIRQWTKDAFTTNLMKNCVKYWFEKWWTRRKLRIDVETRNQWCELNNKNAVIIVMWMIDELLSSHMKDKLFSVILLNTWMYDEWKAWISN